MRGIKIFAAVLAALLVWAPSKAQESVRADTQTAVFRILDPEGIVIGEHTEGHEIRADGSSTTLKRVVSFTIDGHEPVNASREFTVERDQNGNVQRLSASFGNGQTSIRYVAEIADGTATITRRERRSTKSYEQVLPSGIPIEDPDRLTQHITGPFLAFDPRSGRFVEQAFEWSEQPADARFRGDLRITFSNGIPVDAWVIERDTAGKPVAAVQPQPGSPFRYQLTEGPVSIDRGGRIGHPMLPAPYTIGTGARAGHIRYRLTLAPALAKFLPENGQQAVSLSEEGVRIDICPTCGAGLPDDPATLANWTHPTAWLQSDFTPIAKAGASTAKRKWSDRRKLQSLGRIVRGRMDQLDHNGHYSARAAWERGAGDCTEDAVLLAALARAAGIPTLVASGVAYTRERYHGAANAFIPHAWVVAYLDGEWVSYDMTLDEGYGAGHLALSMGEGEAGMMVASNMIAGMIEWQGISEVRPRPKEK